MSITPFSFHHLATRTVSLFIGLVKYYCRNVHIAFVHTLGIQKKTDLSCLDSHCNCVPRPYVKIMVSRLRRILHWLMEKPYGACLIITSARNFTVLVL